MQGGNAGSIPAGSTTRMGGRTVNAAVLKTVEGFVLCGFEPHPIRHKFFPLPLPVETPAKAAASRGRAQLDGDSLNPVVNPHSPAARLQPARHCPGRLFFRRLTMRERLYDWICDKGAAALTWTVLLLLVPMLLTGGM